MSRRSTPGALGSNPYVVGPPVYGKGPFFGREKALSGARGSASRGGLFLVDGAPRVGKTSFLLHIAAGAPASHIPCHLEVEVGGVSWPHFPERIAQALNIEVEVITSGDGADTPVSLGEAVAEAAAPRLKKKRLVLYLDIQTGAEGAEAAAFVLEAVSKGPRISAFIACHDAQALISAVPALGEHKRITLGLLAPKAARHLIRSLTEGSLSFEEEAVLHLLDLSGRHPQILQALCHETFEYVRARPVDSVGMMEIVAAAKDLEKESGSLSWLFRDLERPLPLLLSAMAEAAPIDRSIFKDELNSVLSNYDLSLEKDDIAEGLRRLEERGLVRRESKGRFAFNIELLRRWLIRHQPMADQPEARLDLEAAKAKAARHLEDGRNALLLGRAEDAIEHLLSALKVQPTLEEARVELARSYVDTGNYEAALDVYEEGVEPWPAGYRSEVGEAYVQWAGALQEAGKSVDSALERAQALVPNHPDVRAWRIRRDVDSTRKALNSARTWEAFKALKALGEGGDPQALETVRDDAMTHLEGAILAGAARKGRAVLDLVQLLESLYPEDHRPSFLLAESIVGEGERIESSSPPAALSQYRRAEETLRGVGEIPHQLAERLRAGRERVAALFLQEQEASLEQLLADGQFDAASQLAQELIDEHNSETAKGILARLEEQVELEARYERILNLMAQDGRSEARRLARDLATASPEFTGSDGRTAAQLLEELRDEDSTVSMHLRDVQPQWMPPTPAGRRGPPVPLGPLDEDPDDDELEDEGGRSHDDDDEFDSPLTWSIPSVDMESPAPGPPLGEMPSEPEALEPEPSLPKGGWSRPPGTRGGAAPSARGPEHRAVYGPRRGYGGWIAFGILLILVLLYVVYKEGRFGEDGEPQAMVSDIQPKVPVVAAPEALEPEPEVKAPEPTPKGPTPKVPVPAPETPRPQFLPSRAKETPPKASPSKTAEAPVLADAPKAGAKQAEEIPGIAKPVDVVVEALPRALSEGEKKEAERHLMEARQSAQRGAYRSAVESYEASLAIDGSQSSIYQDLGLIYYALKDLSASERAFREALKLKPNAIAQFDLAKVLRLQGKYIQAREAFEGAIASPGLPASMVKEAKDFLESLPEAAALPEPSATKEAQPTAPTPKQAVEGQIWGEGGAPVKLFGEGNPGK